MAKIGEIPSTNAGFGNDKLSLFHRRLRLWSGSGRFFAGCEKKTDALFFLCVCVSCDAELATATCSSKAPWSKSIFFLYFLSLWVGPTLRFTSCTNFNQHRMPPKNCDICPLPFRLRSKYFFLYFQVKTWLDTFFE